MPKRRSIDSLLQFYCNQYAIDVDSLRGRSRKQFVCYYRHGFCALAKSQGFTLKEIGEVINRDHSTVISSVEKHLELVHDKKYRKLLNIQKTL